MAFFLRRLRDHAQAEDFTQEVLVRLLAAPMAQERPDSYVFQIAQNLLIDQARAEAVRARHRLAITGDTNRDLDTRDPHSIAEGREQLAMVVAALQALPERTRMMFILYRFEKMQQDEIGATYGISASAVKQQIAKATTILTQALRAAR